MGQGVSRRLLSVVWTGVKNGDTPKWVVLGGPVGFRLRRASIASTLGRRYPWEQGAGTACGVLALDDDDSEVKGLTEHAWRMLYDREVRYACRMPGYRREETPHVVRYVSLHDDKGFILWSNPE